MPTNAKLPAGVWVAGWLVFLAMLTLLVMAWLEGRENPNRALANSTATSLVLERGQYGHYLVPGKINGKPVTFLVDTGASSVAIPAKIAAGLDLGKGVAGLSNTANGMTETRRMLARSVSVGGIRLEKVPVSVLPNATGDEVLLGMSFLKHLDWQQQGEQMRLALPSAAVSGN